MKKFSITWFVSSVALAFTAWILGSHMSIGAAGASTISWLITLAIVGALFTAVSEFVGQIIKFLAIPFIIVTLGLMLIVINAGLLLLTEWIAGLFNIDFFVDGFWWAALASIVISISQAIVGSVVSSDD